MPTPGLQVVVRFDKAIPGDAQGEAMLQFEQTLRRLTKMDVRVTKDLMGDDSKLRKLMSLKERNSL